MRQFKLSLGALNLFHWTTYKRNPVGKPLLIADTNTESLCFINVSWRGTSLFDFFNSLLAKVQMIIYKIHNCRTNIYKKSFLPTTISKWNAFPIDI